MTSTIILTIAIVVISLLCTAVITVAAVAIPFIIMRNNSKKAEALMATGTQGEALIVQMEDTGMLINNNPRVALLLEVQIPGYAAYQVKKTVTVPLIRLSQVQPGSVVRVMADPTQPTNPDKIGLLLQ